MTKPKQKLIQVRLEQDVEALAKKSADQNARSLPAEVNHTLKKAYSKRK